MAPNLVRHPSESFRCPWNQNAAAGLLLLRHVTPLTRRDVVYFYSGAHTEYWPLPGPPISKHWYVPVLGFSRSGGRTLEDRSHVTWRWGARVVASHPVQLR